MAWYTFQIKTLYNSNTQYKKLAESLISSNLGFTEKDIFFPGNLERENPYVNYVFVRTDKNFHLLWPHLCEEKYISGYDGWLPISDLEMEKVMKGSSQKKIQEDLAEYDVVTITYGPYAKMFGIITEVKKDCCEIGFNFFTGPQFKLVEKDFIQRKKSLFEIWKFPVL